MRTRVVAVVLAVLVVGAGLLTWRLLTPASAFDQALSTLPKGTLRVTFTDWEFTRSAAHGESLGAGSSPADVSDFLTRAYDQDRTFTSGISDSTYVLAHRFGFSPLDAQWEALGQGREGQVDVLRVDDDVDLGGVENNLRTLGYTPPSGGSGTGGVWVGGADLVAQIDGSLTPVEQNVAVLPDQHLVLLSDSASYLQAAVSVAKGDGDSVRDTTGVDDLAGVADTPANAVLWASSFACEDLSMGTASEEDQRYGNQLVAKAGGINPLSGLVMAQQHDGSIDVGLWFDTSDEASANLQPRVNLASGDAPGQGGSFRDRFRVTDGQASGHTVTLRLAPRASADAVLSDLTTGPILFATC